MSSSWVSVGRRDRSETELVASLDLRLNECVELQVVHAPEDRHWNLAHHCGLHWVDKSVAIVGLQVIDPVVISNEDFVPVDGCAVRVWLGPSYLYKDVIDCEHRSEGAVWLSCCCNSSRS